MDYRKVNGTTEQFSTNTKNEMTQVPVPGSGTPGVPVYDSNGNMTHDGIDADYTYDAENRLKTAIWYDGTDYWKEEYFYDGLSRIRYSWKYKDAIPGLSIWSYVGGKLYIYDGMVLIQERDINNTTINATYTYGKDVSGSIHGAGGVGGILAGDLGGTTVFYHSDATGNITRLVSSSGSVLATYEYDPYGNMTSKSGSLATTNKMRFSSKIYMDHGNYYYGFRFYSPYLQRWLNRDPIGESGGHNLYGFVKNSSLHTVDPSGLWGVKIGFLPNIGIGDPSFIFDDESYGHLKDGAMAGVDGIVPGYNPLAKMGFYDGCDKDYQLSQAVAGIGRDFAVGAATGGIGLARGGATRILFGGKNLGGIYQFPSMGGKYIGSTWNFNSRFNNFGNIIKHGNGKRQILGKIKRWYVRGGKKSGKIARESAEQKRIMKFGLKNLANVRNVFNPLNPKRWSKYAPKMSADLAGGLGVVGSATAGALWPNPDCP